MVITPGFKVSRSNIDTCGRVASGITVVVSGSFARSFSLSLDSVLGATAIVVIVSGALVAEDEWMMDIDN